MPVSTSILSRIQDLYLLQMQLLEILDGDLSHPKTRKLAREHIVQFEELLKDADHRYMGGEDVLESFKILPSEVMTKMKNTSLGQRAAVRRKKK